MRLFRVTEFLPGVATIILVLGPRSGIAIEIPPIQFGCDGRGSAENTIDYEPGLLFEATTQEALRLQQKLPSPGARFGPFDASRYGFRTIEFFIDTLPIDRSGLVKLPDPPAEIRLIARTRGADGETWWRLGPAQDSDLQSSMYPPHWDTPTQIGGAALPVFSFSWGHQSQGNGAECGWTNVLVLDFRSSVPLVPVAFGCGDCEYFGQCNVWDMSSARRRAIDCSWNAGKSDFVCLETTTVPLGWAERTYERSFLLLSQQVLTFTEVNRLAAPSIKDVIGRLQDGRVKLGEALIVAEIGPLTAIASLPNSRNGAPRFLLATPGRGCDADFRFYVATAPRSSEPTATVVPSTCAGDELDLKVSETNDCANAESLGTCTGPGAKFGLTNTLVASDRLRFLRVLVEEGKGRWVYLIGLDDRLDPPRTEALLLATDTADHTHCGEYSFQAQLVPSSIDVRPFRALVDIEPAHRGYWIDGQARRAELAKPRSAAAAKAEVEPWQRGRLLWTDSDGFVLLRTEQADTSEHEPLVVIIDDAGQVSLHRQ